MHCTVCRIPLDDGFREHYASLYHINNLRRRQSGLPPANEVVHEEKAACEMYECECGMRYLEESKYVKHRNGCTDRHAVNEMDRCIGNEMDEYANNEVDRHAVNEMIEYVSTDKSYDTNIASTDMPNHTTVMYSNDYDDHPYIRLPSGTVLGNKKYLIYFKQNHERTYKERQMVKHATERVIVPVRERKNTIRVSMGMNSIMNGKMSSIR